MPSHLPLETSAFIICPLTHHGELIHKSKTHSIPSHDHLLPSPGPEKGHAVTKTLPPYLCSLALMPLLLKSLWHEIFWIDLDATGDCRKRLVLFNLAFLSLSLSNKPGLESLSHSALTLYPLLLSLTTKISRRKSPISTSFWSGLLTLTKDSTVCKGDRNKVLERHFALPKFYFAHAGDEDSGYM